MTFDPPKTQAELDEILRVCRFTSYGPEEQTAIQNVYARHIDPRAPFCGGCGDAPRYQRMISAVATQKANDWRSVIDGQASPKEEVKDGPSLFGRITNAVQGYINDKN